MGLLDKLKGMFGQPADKAESPIDKAGEVVDDKTGGSYSEQIDRGTDAAQDTVDRLGDEEGGTER